MILVSISVFITLCVENAAMNIARERRKGGTQWAPHVPLTADHYCQESIFGNQKDFIPANTLIETMFKNKPNVTIFVTGTNDGKDIDTIFHKDWYQPRKAHIYGWEIVGTTIAQAELKLQGHLELELNRAAVSDSDGKEVYISGHGGTAGVYPPFAHGFLPTLEHVPTIRWSSFVLQRQISEVSYALIDVEGHEMAVIAGMDLQHFKHKFPVFQYELGGTWVDERHAGSMTQGEAANYLSAEQRTIAGNVSKSSFSTQQQAARVRVAHQLTSLGYRIYMMGHNNGVPVLAPASPQTFQDAKCRNIDGQYFIQGNALAVLEAAGEQMPWLAQIVDKLVINDAELPPPPPMPTHSPTPKKTLHKMNWQQV